MKLYSVCAGSKNHRWSFLSYTKSNVGADGKSLEWTEKQWVVVRLADDEMMVKKEACSQRRRPEGAR